MIKILHIADTHLDCSFGSRQAKAQRELMNSQRKSFAAAIDFAVEEKVMAVVLAGDLLDTKYLSLSTERWLRGHIERLISHSIVVVYCTGNHDPSIGNSVTPILRSLGVVIGDSSEATSLVIDADGSLVRFVTAGHETGAVSENLVSTFPTAKPGEITVGVVHAFVAGRSSSDRHEKYAPCSVQDLRSKKYNYWALGHIHAAECVDQDANAWYSGTLQGRSYRESGPKGGLLVTLTESSTDVQFVSFAQTIWDTIQIDDIANLETIADLEGRIVQAIDEKKIEYDNQPLALRIQLSGSSPLAPRLKIESERHEFEQELSDAQDLTMLELDVTSLHIPLDLDAIKRQQHVLADVLRQIDDLDVFSGRDFLPDIIASRAGSSEEDMRELLEGIDLEIASRFMSDKALTS